MGLKAMLIGKTHSEISLTVIMAPEQIPTIMPQRTTSLGCAPFVWRIGTYSLYTQHCDMESIGCHKSVKLLVTTSYAKIAHINYG